MFAKQTKPVKIVLPTSYSNLSREGRMLVRMEYRQLQKDMCYYCHSPLKHDPPTDILEKRITPRLYPVGFFNHPIHLHHDHDTDLTIGAVHNYCNAVLWEYEGV